MHRLEFINTGLAILGLSFYQQSKNMNINQQLLIGKGNPKLV